MMDSISWTILVLIAILAIHLVEEIKTGFREKFPLGEMPKPLFAGINVVLYTFCFTTFLLSLRRDVGAVPFAWVFAIAMSANGLGHVWIMIVKRGYFPGGLTAPVLTLVSAYLISLLVGQVRLAK